MLFRSVADTFLFGTAHIVAFYAWGTIMAGGSVAVWSSASKMKLTGFFIICFDPDFYNLGYTNK